MKLRKALGLSDVFSIASGAMISSGIFILPGLAHAQAGPAVVLSYFLAGLFALTGMLSIAELATAMPRAGGDYFFITRGLGPAVGTVAGLLSWFSLSLKSAFALVGMAAFTVALIDVDIHLLAMSLCALFVGINLIGVKEAGRFQVILVAGLLISMSLFILKGLPAVNIRHFEPFAPYGLGAIFSTAGFVFVSYGGLLKVASMAEEVKNPGRVIPLGLILSLLIVSVLYTLMVFVTTGVLGSAVLDHSLTPISDAAHVFMGSWGGFLLSLAAILAFVTTANAGIMAASRYLMASSRDGLLPTCIGRVSARFGTPHVALLVTGTFVALSLVLRLDVLIKAASTILILTYLLANLSIIILRESRLVNYQPRFKTPLYPWIQIMGIVGFGFLILEMGGEALLMSAFLILGGLCVFLLYGRFRAVKEYALLHLIERITARELVSGSLESELKEIVRERDEIVKDRFDQMIEEGDILDIEKSISAEQFFALSAKAMSAKLETDWMALFQALLAREKESSTVITPNLAIPHVIIEGEHNFAVLMARCKEGIGFSERAPLVHIVFVLVGTRDERNLHLRALAAIAQIVQASHFEDRWMAAKNKESLRDIVLLGERRRDGV